MRLAPSFAQMDVRKRDGRVRVTDEQGVRATVSNDLQISNSGAQKEGWHATCALWQCMQRHCWAAALGVRVQ